MMEGRIQKMTMAGEATVESLDPDMVGKLLHYLDLTTLVSSYRQTPAVAAQTVETAMV